jgi:hypothetical protein
VAAGMPQSVFIYARLNDLDNPASAQYIPDGIPVSIKGALVSAVFDGNFYIQSAGRTGGLRVNWTGSVHIGQIVDVVGVMATIDGERALNATAVTGH